MCHGFHHALGVEKTVDPVGEDRPVVAAGTPYRGSFWPSIHKFQTYLAGKEDGFG
jgi:hypothetical protein